MKMNENRGKFLSLLYDIAFLLALEGPKTEALRHIFS